RMEDGGSRIGRSGVVYVRARQWIMSGFSNFDPLSSILDFRFGLEKLDQPDLVSLLVVLQLVDQTASDHDAEAAFPKPHLLPHVQVADRIAGLGRVRQVVRIEARPGVTNDDGDFL